MREPWTFDAIVWFVELRHLKQTTKFTIVHYGIETAIKNKKLNYYRYRHCEPVTPRCGVYHGRTFCSISVAESLSVSLSLSGLISISIAIRIAIPIGIRTFRCLCDVFQVIKFRYVIIPVLRSFDRCGRWFAKERCNLVKSRWGRLRVARQFSGGNRDVPSRWYVL